MKNEKIKQVKHVGSRIGYFEINKIDKHGTERSYRLIKDFSPELDQEGLAEFYDKSKDRGNPLPINSIQLGELFRDVINSTNNNLKNYFFKALEAWGVGTLTRIVYSLKDLEHWNNCSIEDCLSSDNRIYHFFETAFKNRGKDEIIHNYGTSDSFSFFGDVLGNRGKMRDLKNKIFLDKIFGVPRIHGSRHISLYFNGFDTIPEKDWCYFGPESEEPKFDYHAVVSSNSFNSKLISFKMTENLSDRKKSFLIEKIS